MATSYPDRTNARGIWTLSEITKNIKTEGTFPIGGARGIWMGGGAPGISDVIDYLTFSTTGDAADFGDLSVARSLNAGGSSFTRCFCTGGAAPGVSDVIDYVTFASTGDAADFGNLTDQRHYLAGMSNETRLIASGGTDPGYSNILDYITMSSTGNAVDFGNLTVARCLQTCQASPTRGINAGGVHNPGSVTNLNTIDFIEIASTGDAVDFGDLTAAQRSQSSFGSQTRMCMAGGQAPGTTKIEKIEFGSLGNATDFADSLAGTTENGRGTSDGKRGVFAHGSVSNALYTKNIFDGGAAADFVDLTLARTTAHAASDSHGGLQAFDPRAPELYSPTGKVVPYGVGVGQVGLFTKGVGKNLQDHLETYIQQECKTPDSLYTYTKLILKVLIYFKNNKKE